MANNFDSTNIIQVYELNGEELKGLKSKKPIDVKVTNHWNRKDFINIQIGENKVTVVADDLKRAIDNAQNAHRF